LKRVMYILLAAVLLSAIAASAASSVVPLKPGPGNWFDRIPVFGDVNWSSDPDKNSGPPAPFDNVWAAMQNVNNLWFNHTICLGDLVNDNSSEGWNGYEFVDNDTPHTDYVSHETGPPYVFFHAAGDNDRLEWTSRETNWESAFPNEDTSHIGSIGKTGYRIIYLDSTRGGSGTPGGPYSGRAGSLQYIKDLLPTLSQPQTIVVVMHQPLERYRGTGLWSSQRSEMESYFAAYGVDLVVAADTHVFRRTDVTCTSSVTGHTGERVIPFLQIPAAASHSHATFAYNSGQTGENQGSRLDSGEWGWMTRNYSASNHGWKGFITLDWTQPSNWATGRPLVLRLWKVPYDSSTPSEVTNCRSDWYTDNWPSGATLYTDGQTSYPGYDGDPNGDPGFLDHTAL